MSDRARLAAAVRRAVVGHPMLPGRLEGLAAAYRGRYTQTAQPADLAHAEQAERGQRP